MGSILVAFCVVDDFQLAGHVQHMLIVGIFCVGIEAGGLLLLQGL